MHKYLRLKVVEFMTLFFIAIAPTYALEPLVTKLIPIPCSTVSELYAVDMKETGDRLILEKPKPVVFTFGRPPVELTPGGTATETKRQSQILLDAEAVLKQIGTITGVVAPAMAPAPAPTDPLSCARYDPNYLRSTLVVAMKMADGSAANKTFVVGPTENFYISADVPATDIKQFQFDSKNNRVVQAKAPAFFYLGLSYKIGDIYTNYPSASTNNLVVKLLVRASSRPNSSAGIGIGYTFKYFDAFVARVSTSADTNAVAPSSGRLQSNIFGLSFNISKGLSWLSEK